MPSQIQEVEGITVEDVVATISPSYLKTNYLNGLDFVDENGVTIPAQWYAVKLRTAIATFERITKVRILRRTITAELHDYYAQDYAQFMYLNLFEYPVVSVESISAMYPTGQIITTFPNEWVRLDKMKGQIQLVPTNGTLSQVILGQGGSYLPILFGTMSKLPQLFHIDYTAGFEDGKIPTDLIDAIMKLATIEVLANMGDTIFPPGVSSISAGVDGLSQGMGIVNNGDSPPVFAGRVNTYTRDLYGDPRMPNKKGALQEIKDDFRGILLSVM